MSDYDTMLRSKARATEVEGIDAAGVHPLLFPWQAELVRWAAKLGRAGIFADCGLGKTLIQLEWARAVGGPTLIVAPLAVASQTIAEAARIGLTVAEVADPTDEPIQITNYEKLHRFEPSRYRSIVLDESSILKSIDGKTRTRLLREWTGIPYRLCCTATPAPNDVAELGNHAEFLGQATRAEMLAEYFVHDDTGWRQKGHAAEAFWRWIAGWAAFVRRPSDLGFADNGFMLPELRIRDEIVRATKRPVGALFADAVGGVRGRLEARRGSVDERIARAAEIIRARPGQWVVWCGLNAEAECIADALGDEAVEVSGASEDEEKIANEKRWRTGEVRVLVSKPRIFGFGMNWQHCGQVMFLGIGDSYEQYYQAIRRCWRFGRRDPVECIIVISDAETEIAGNVRRKEQEAAKMADETLGAVRGYQLRADRDAAEPEARDETDGGAWRMLLGDSVERLAELPDGSVGLSVFSPPFASLYTYSASPRDMGNSRGYAAFWGHYRFLIAALKRATMAGRRACVHVQQVSLLKARDGVIGWYDFRADMVREFVAAGWIYDGEVVIDKDPQAQAIRTHSKALLFVQKERDASWLRPAMADYILLFRAPGDNPEPVKPGDDVSNEEWIQWARPIWYGIDETDTLNTVEAREEKDERHICPLQLGTIERCVRLWSNRGDLVLDPFAGIGSTGYVAVRHGRRFIGCELKRAYYNVALKNLTDADRQLPLFGAR